MEYSYLVTRDSKSKIRAIELRYEATPEIGHIYRKTGLLGGKMTEQPLIEILEGKQKRDIQAQTHLQFMSWRKKFLDKGYKELNGPFNTYTRESLELIVGKEITNQYGVIKPMLAKQADKVTNKKIFDNVWYASRKLDGLRTLIYKDSKGAIRTASRGGEVYDIALSHILVNPVIKGIFNNYPSLILDGEAYRHGVKLQDVSGACRRETGNTDWIEYFVYDIYDSNNPEMPFIERLTLINKLEQEFQLAFDPRHESNYTLPIHICPHYKVSGKDNIMNLHNEFVSDGYEGVVIRDPNKPYKPNSRGNQMLKVKIYKAEDYKVIGYELGLRGSEDMVFICEMEDGKTFRAMPVGDRSIKAEYVENFESKYKGHKAECTYFILSNDGIPQQPKLRTFRFDLE